MIPFNQQIEILHTIYKKFDKEPGWQSVERAPLFLSAEKLSRRTVIDFKVIAIYVMVTYIPRNFTDLLEKLNKLNEADILEAMRFKSAIISRQWHTEKDLKLLDATDNPNPYSMLIKKEISIFGFHAYVKREGNAKGRLAAKKFNQISILIDFFK